MAKAVRHDTEERVAIVQARHPMHIGPFFGRLCIASGISAPLAARVLGAHEQTVIRWWFARSMVQPQWTDKIGRMVMFLSWMLNTGRAPLQGTTNERLRMLIGHAAEFDSLARRNATTTA